MIFWLSALLSLGLIWLHWQQTRSRSMVRQRVEVRQQLGRQGAVTPEGEAPAELEPQFASSSAGASPSRLFVLDTLLMST